MAALAVTGLDPALRLTGYAPGFPALSAPAGSRNTGSAVLARAEGLRLVMVEERGCRYCIKWDQDVGKGYARTAEGRAAPLLRVKRNAPVLKGLAPVIYTPTFILIRNGGELGRITGYPGQMYFWEELTTLMHASGYRSGAIPDQRVPHLRNG